MTDTATADATSFEQIAEALDLDSLPIDEQEQIMLDLNGLIFRGSLVRLYEQMDGATRDSFTKLLESDASPDELQAFLKDKVPGAESAVRSAVQDLVDDILAVTK